MDVGSVFQQGLHHWHVPILTSSQQGSAPILWMERTDALDMAQLVFYQEHFHIEVGENSPRSNKLTFLLSFTLSLFCKDLFCFLVCMCVPLSLCECMPCVRGVPTEVRREC